MRLSQKCRINKILSRNQRSAELKTQGGKVLKAQITDDQCIESALFYILSLRLCEKINLFRQPHLTHLVISCRDVHLWRLKINERYYSLPLTIAT